jgi:diguanylate cyclase (GGDEF)-like protein
VEAVTIVTALVAVVAAVGIAAGVGQIGRARRAEAEVSRLRQELREARHAAAHDPLTGLPNRRAFYWSAPALVADEQRRPLVAVLVDLDDFKRVNDTLGHAVGDRVLVTLARRFSELARGGLVARLGGDEFVGLLDWPGADSQRTHEAGRMLTTALAAPIVLPDAGVAVTASVGLVSTCGPADLDELLDRADAAMYRAKSQRGGGGPSCWPDLEPVVGPDRPGFEWWPGRTDCIPVSASRHRAPAFDPARTSPTANTAGMLVSSGRGARSNDQGTSTSTSVRTQPRPTG